LNGLLVSQRAFSRRVGLDVFELITQAVDFVVHESLVKPRAAFTPIDDNRDPATRIDFSNSTA
jgi:hypothetical protein